MKRANFKLPSIPKKRFKLGQQCRDQIETVFPEILDEIRGIATVVEICYDELSAFLLTHPMSIPKCSIFAVTDREQTFMGRNYDMFYWLKEYTESYLTEPTGEFKSIGQTDIFVGREDGVNERGLGVAMSGIPAYFEPGITFWINIRYLLDKCRSVREGVAYLTDIPHHCTITFLLADPTGDMAVVEASPQRAVVREVTDGYIVSTNHLNHPDMRSLKLFEPPDSRPRYDCILESLGRHRGPLDDVYIKNILSSHDGMVCSHLDKEQLGTLWSVVTNLTTRQIWRAEGHPCSNPYMEDDRLKEKKP